MSAAAQFGSGYGRNGFICYMVEEFKRAVLAMQPSDFEAAALEAFAYQYSQNPVYQSYVNALKREPKKVRSLLDIPFLPVGFFKTHRVACSDREAEVVFVSSTTSGLSPSLHYIFDLEFYRRVSQEIFEREYGKLSDYHIFALLPSYLERGNSSLVCMVENFMRYSRKPSGFYLHNHEQLLDDLRVARESGGRILLIGVSFALWELAERQGVDLSGCIVMETGGMKGRRRELVREELHEILCKGLSVREIHSEYGMTELLSQFYSHGQGIFGMPPWCRVLTRQVNDPFAYTQGYGGLNVVDLAGIESCCFLELSDLGKILESNKFVVIGRADHADIRGCNLMF